MTRVRKAPLKRKCGLCGEAFVGDLAEASAEHECPAPRPGRRVPKWPLKAPMQAPSTAEVREQLMAARALIVGLRQQVIGRDATIRAVEAERDAARAQAVELTEALAQACATPAAVILERDVYRAALADIEAALHRLGMNCGCAGHEDGGA